MVSAYPATSSSTRHVCTLCCSHRRHWDDETREITRRTLESITFMGRWSCNALSFVIGSMMWGMFDHRRGLWLRQCVHWRRLQGSVHHRQHWHSHDMMSLDRQPGYIHMSRKERILEHADATDVRAIHRMWDHPVHVLQRLQPAYMFFIYIVIQLTYSP